MDYRRGNRDIYAQRFARDGTPSGYNFKVNDDPQSANQYYPSVSMAHTGQFVITWEDWRNGNPDIYIQCFTNNGNPIGNNFILTNTYIMEQLRPEVSLCNGRIFNTWIDNRSGNTIYNIWTNVLDWLK